MSPSPVPIPMADIAGRQLLTRRLDRFHAVGEIGQLLLREFLGVTVTFLENTYHLITLTCNHGQVIVCQLPPFFLDFANLRGVVC